jgi:N-acetyl-gamma-glutamyl-phosphate reductase
MNAGIIGATGYAGCEIARLLAGHPRVDSLSLSSASFEGERIADLYPNFLGRLEGRLVKAEALIETADVVFAALPHGVGEPFAGRCYEKGIPYIDMSADFRFDDDEETYRAWYGKRYEYPALHQKSVYGLCELNRAAIKNARLIGNPGCYPTCASLAAYPALAKGFADDDGTVIIDAASGITGGGREPARSYHFPECSDSCGAYKVGAHRHTPEISRNFSKMEGKQDERHIVFTPHLAPMNRGILATLYIPLAKQYRAHSSNGKPPRPRTHEIEQLSEEVRAVYTGFYKDEQFVRVLPAGLNAATGRVRLSNYCDIAVDIDQCGKMLIISAAIDNMIKGAAGQAVQNMNIIFGFNESDGLEFLPALF